MTQALLLRGVQSAFFPPIHLPRSQVGPQQHHWEIFTPNIWLVKLKHMFCLEGRRIRISSRDALGGSMFCELGRGRRGVWHSACDACLLVVIGRGGNGRDSRDETELRSVVPLIGMCLLFKFLFLSLGVFPRRFPLLSVLPPHTG